MNIDMELKTPDEEYQFCLQNNIGWIRGMCFALPIRERDGSDNEWTYVHSGAIRDIVSLIVYGTMEAIVIVDNQGNQGDLIGFNHNTRRFEVMYWVQDHNFPVQLDVTQFRFMDMDYYARQYPELRKYCPPSLFKKQSPYHLPYESLSIADIIISDLIDEYNENDLED